MSTNIAITAAAVPSIGVVGQSQNFQTRAAYDVSQEQRFVVSGRYISFFLNGELDNATSVQQGQEILVALIQDKIQGYIESIIDDSAGYTYDVNIHLTQVRRILSLTNGSNFLGSNDEIQVNYYLDIAVDL